MGEARLCPACRRTLLSRYNQDPLCASCMRAARSAPLAGTGAPAWLWDSQPWRDALARVDLGAALAVFRAASGLSQHQLAEITGWSQSTLSLFESGHRDTLYDIRVWLRFAEAVDMPREALLPLVGGQTDPTPTNGTLAERSVMEGTGVDLDRRTFGGLAAGAAAAAILPEISVPARVTTSHVRYLRACADSLWQRDQSVGGAVLLKQALRQWHRARRMLDESSYSEMIGRELIRVTGSMAVCAGWLAFDGGHVPLARQLHAEALLLAGSADDTILTSQALQQASMLASYVARTTGSAGHAREGLRLADQAADVARHERMPRLHALIALRRANAVSLMGDQPSFTTAIARARHEMGHAAGADDPQWIRFVDEFEIQGQEAIGHMNLGAPEQSAAVHQVSLQEPELAPRNRVCAQAQLAAAVVASGDTRSAIGEAMEVLPALEDGLTSVRALNELRSVRTAAKRADDDEFCARFDTVERTLNA